MNKEILRMQMLSGIITESEYKAKLKKNKSPLNENLKFSQIEKDRKYFATTNFGIFKKGDEVFVDTVRNLGNEVVIELSNNKEQSDSIKGDLEDEVEVFDNDMKESLKENFVGMGMVGNIFDREKTDYEIAFEHFLGSKYINEDETSMNTDYDGLDPDDYDLMDDGSMVDPETGKIVWSPERGRIKEEEVKEGNLGSGETYSIEPEGRFWIVSWRGMEGPKEKVFQSEEEAREFASILDENK
jgi:hypothetical protein